MELRDLDIELKSKAWNSGRLEICTLGKELRAWIIELRDLVMELRL
jgi:hypothetical protein